MMNHHVNVRKLAGRNRRRAIVKNMVNLNLLIALLLVSMSSAGCGDGAEGTIAGMEGKLWKLDSYVNTQGESVGVLPGTEITAEFSDSQVSGSAGCNRYFGSCEVDANYLTLGPVGATMMACEPSVNEQERQYLAVLESAASYQVTDGKLRIANADSETVLTFSVLEPALLTGRTWQLNGYNNGRGGFMSVLADSEITAVFGDDGSLAGSAGCNHYTASFEVDGEAIWIGPVGLTRMMCWDPEGIMEQESAYLAALESAATYQIKGALLEVRDSDGMRVLSYTADTY